MFAKKLLSLVAFLFVGGQTVYGAAATIATTCSQTNYEVASDLDEAVATSVCIKNEKIYILDASSNAYTSVITLENGINVLTIDGVNIKKENLSAAVTDATKLAIYDCKENECKQTYGYVYDTTQYIEVSHSSDSKAVVPVTENIENETDCAENVGELIETGGKVYLCLANDKSVELKDTGTGKNYFMTNAADNIFSDASSTTYPNLVVKDSDKALTFNNVYTDEEYCVYSSNLVMSRIEQFCTSSILDNLYSCDEGKCSASESPIGKGNYIVKDDSEDFHLYACEYDSGNDGPVHCNKAGRTLDGLVVVQDTENDEGYVFQKALEKSDLVGISNIGSVTLYLYDCKEGDCQRTDGFVKHATDLNSMAMCPNDGKCVAAEDITVTGVAVIKSNLAVEDIDASGTTLFTVAVGDNYFYKKANDKVVLIKTVDDGEAEPNLMIVGVAKYLGNSIIADKTSYKVVESCTVSTETTHTINASGEVTESVDCEITTPCDLKETGAAHCKKGYYLQVTDGGNKRGTTRLANDEEEGVLFYCDTDTTCAEATVVGTGLYKNNDEVTEGHPEYIKCSGTSTCTGLAAVSANDDCSGAGVGGIITHTETYTTYKLCLNAESSSPKTILLSTNEPAVETDIGSKFFISINDANPFGSGSSKYVLIEPKADGTAITILKNETDGKKYKYTNDSYKVRSRKDQGDVCNVNGTVKSTIYEFKKEEGQYTYEKYSDKVIS